MSKVVCLDSHIVVWGIKSEAEQGQEPKIGRAQELLRILTDEKAIILIPAPVLSEILLRVPPEEHGRVTNMITARFRVPPFDAACAAIAAQIRQRLLSEGEFKKIQATSTREAIKFDIQILAIAKLHGAKTVYSEDRGLANAAKVLGGAVRVSPMPPIGPQGTLFPDDPKPKRSKVKAPAKANKRPKPKAKAAKKAAPKKTKR